MAGARHAPGAIGCFLGLSRAVVASRLLRSFAFGVSQIDPAILTISAVAMLLLALAALFVPVPRVSMTDPALAMWGE
jgi:hypothetical protein